MANNDHYIGVMLEDIQSQIQRMAEAVADVLAQVTKIAADVEILKIDMKAVKAAITNQSKHLKYHQDHISHLQTVCA